MYLSVANGRNAHLLSEDEISAKLIEANAHVSFSQKISHMESLVKSNSMHFMILRISKIYW